MAGKAPAGEDGTWSDDDKVGTGLATFSGMNADDGCAAVGCLYVDGLGGDC